MVILAPITQAHQAMDGYDADELTSYTSLSVLAVCALVVSLLSVLALMVPLLVVLPLAGIVLALLAMGHIKAAAGALSGRSLAVTALFLSVAFAAASPVRVLVRDAVYKSQADQAARQWLELLVEGNELAALDYLTNDAIYGLTHPGDLDRSAKPPEPEAIAAELKQTPLVVALVSLSPAERRQMVTQAIHCDVQTASPQVAIEYLAGKEKPVHFSVATLRRKLAAKGATWQINSWSLLD